MYTKQGPFEIDSSTYFGSMELNNIVLFFAEEIKSRNF